jgi:hypothetical protein
MAEATVAAGRGAPGELRGPLRLYERLLRAANRADSTVYKYFLTATLFIEFLEAAGMRGPAR